MALYPSQEWCDDWKTAMNNNEAVAEAGKKWGVDFNGNWLFEVTPGAGLEKRVFVYLEAAAGKCLDARMIDDPSTVNPGYFVTGSYEAFKLVVKGEKDFLVAVVKGNLKLKGDMTKIMRNAKFLRAVANSISSFKSEYLGE